VSLSLTFGRNGKVEQHIRKKTRKPKALRFWVEGGVIPLYRFGSVLILVDLPGISPSESPNVRQHVPLLHKFDSTADLIGIDSHFRLEELCVFPDVLLVRGEGLLSNPPCKDPAET